MGNHPPFFDSRALRETPWSWGVKVLALFEEFQAGREANKWERNAVRQLETDDLWSSWKLHKEDDFQITLEEVVYIIFMKPM